MATLAIIDVGHGNSALLQDTDGTTLFDAGRGNALIEFLRQEGVTRIDLVLISHSDRDHLEGLVALLAAEEFEIGTIRLNPDAGKNSRLWNDLLYVIDHGDQTGKWQFLLGLTTKQTGSLDQGSVHVEVLAPTQFLIAKGSVDDIGRALTSNSLSVVIKLSVNDQPVALLPGDIDQVGLLNILERGEDLSAPLMIFPHHGGDAHADDIREFTHHLCEAVQPDAIFFSIGRGEYGTPKPEVVATIRQSFPNARIACTQLSRHCAENCPAALSDHLLPQFAKGKAQRQCCGGTFVFDLSDPSTLAPTREQHLAFIHANAETALCIGRGLQ